MPSSIPSPSRAPLAAKVRGHAWTVLPELRHRMRPHQPPLANAWSVGVVDPRLGTVTLRGLVRHEVDASTLLLVVHGLGGSTTSPYCLRMAGLAARRGWSSLRLGLRGSGGDGEDLYHADIGDDLGHALAEPSLARYARVLVVGYSLGGHVSLGHAMRPDPRVAAVAALCAPLDLARSCAVIDRRRAWIYRSHILRGLKDGYRRVAARRVMPTPVEQVDRVRTIRQWDALTVVPRFGFDDVDDYYRRASVGPRLSELQRPALYLGMRHDPMVPPSAVEPSLDAVQRAAGRSATGDRGGPTVRWLDDGGHVGGPGSWEHEVLQWLDHHGR